MYLSPACVSAPVDPHTVDTDTQTLLISLVNVPPIKTLRQSVSVPAGRGDFDPSDSDEPLKEDTSENVAGTRMMKRTETTK